MQSLGKFIGILTGIIIISLGCSNSIAKHKAAPVAKSIFGTQNLSDEINRIVQDVDSNANIGIQIKSMKNGDLLYSRNENHLFVPASILKIITAQAALLYLGPEYKFTTTLVTDAKAINNGVVQGNVYLKHSGDPSLTFYDLTDLMVALKSRQIQQINGNVYIDNTAYDDVQYGPGWIWNDKRFCFAAPISASIIDHNCLTFQILPSKSVGKLANIVESPRFYYSFIQNSVVTKSAYSRSCYIHLTNNADSSISVTGCMPKGKYAQGVTTVISDVIDYNKSMMRDLFKRAGIQVTGSIEVGAAPANAQAIATHDSKPLHLLINKMLKMSDNIIAGSIFKKIGSIYSKQPGSWENGRTAVSNILAQKAGVNTLNMNVLDGSGLSRYNQITPSQMMQLLDFSYHHFATNYEFISALPIAGVDGTLKGRLRNIAWKVRAKTGTMSGVVALAGYAISQDKEPIAFVIMVNGRNGLGWKYKDLEDRIVTALTKYSRT
jgi:D-alanyl-D-alanine carboxypeptidase/D-alanyl-D-alanine-endopeptidase (penicillin-binding protein 4)